jgi:hypothetical protein
LQHIKLSHNCNFLQGLKLQTLSPDSQVVSSEFQLLDVEHIISFHAKSHISFSLCYQLYPYKGEYHHHHHHKQHLQKNINKIRVFANLQYDFWTFNLYVIKLFAVTKSDNTYISWTLLLYWSSKFFLSLPLITRFDYLWKIYQTPIIYWLSYNYFTTPSSFKELFPASIDCTNGL